MSGGGGGGGGFGGMDTMGNMGGFGGRDMAPVGRMGGKRPHSLLLGRGFFWCYSVNGEMNLCVVTILNLRLHFFFPVEICTGQGWVEWIGTLATVTCQ